MEKEEQSHGSRTRFVGRPGMSDAYGNGVTYTKSGTQISFGAAPAACAFAIGIRTPLDQLLLTGFVLAGLARLACFNVATGHVPKDANGKAAYFEGLPIPTSLSIAGVMAFWTYKDWLQYNIPYGTIMQGTILEMHPIVGLFVVHACCMVSRTLHVPKP